MIALSPSVMVTWDQSEVVFTARLQMQGDQRARWNGWVCPHFDRENTQRIVDYNNRAAKTCPDLDTFEWDGDTLVIHSTWDGDEPPDRLEPIVDDAGVQRWPVGAFGWTWYELAPGEAVETFGS
jgi:hypothetical protein